MRFRTMLSAIFICWINLVIAVYREQGTGSTFRERAIATIELVENKLKIEDCIQAATEKANQFYSATDDRHYVILWISMYSRVCAIPDSVLQDDKENRFPFRLNKELRCQYVAKEDKSLTNIFNEVGNIIEESLRFVSLGKYNQLYRGVSLDWPFINQTFFVEEGFFSVSKQVGPALNFGPSGKMYLLIFKSYTGVGIQNYVEDRFRYQREVLGEMGKTFTIDMNVTDKNEIKRIMSTFDLPEKHKDHTPATIFYISQTSGDNKEQILQEQRQKLASYCHVSETSGQLQVKYKCYILVIHFFLLAYSKLVF